MNFQKNHIVEKVEMLARQDRRKDKQNIARVRVLCFLCLFVKYLKGLKSPKSPKSTHNSAAADFSPGFVLKLPRPASTSPSTESPEEERN